MVSIKTEKQKLNMESPSGNSARLFVGGMNLDTTDGTLEEYFSKFGTLTEARITLYEEPDLKGKSKGYGFVTFSDEAELDACQRARPHFIDGTNVSCFRYVPKEEDKKNMSFMDAPRGHCKKLYVSELDHSVKEDDLNCYFGQYGNIIDIELKLGNAQGNAKWKGNFAFIEFDDYDPVDKCIMDGPHRIDGKDAVVRRALAKHGKDFERKIFVGPLTDELTDEMLYNYYKQFGKITRIERPLDKRTKKRKDFAFMEFCSMDPVEKIVQSENHTVEGHELRVKKVGAKDWSQTRASKNIFENRDMWMAHHGPLSANLNPIAMMKGSNLWQNGMPMAMANGMPMAMASVTPGLGALYQGFPAAAPRYGMPMGRSFGALKNERSFGALKSARSYGRFNPYEMKADVEIQMPEQVLIRYFSNFGNIMKVDRPYDSKNQRKRDYAFVEFDNPNSVKMCMLCPSHQIMGMNIIVREGSSKGEPNMENKIFVDLKGKSREARV